MKTKRLKSVVIVWICSILIFSGCATHKNNRVTAVNSSVLASPEAQVGEAIQQEIVKSMPVKMNGATYEYVSAVGSKIVKFAKRKDLNYRFVIIDDERIYSTSAPGGYVYITSGFFKFLEYEDELAAVLAVEIGMLQYRDPRFSKVRKAVGYLIKGGSVVAPVLGPYGSLAVLGLALVDMGINREVTRESRLLRADRLAVKYLSQSGYDPNSLLNLLAKISDSKSVQKPYLYDYLQSHPVSNERLNKISVNLDKMGVPVQIPKPNLKPLNSLSKTPSSI